jgi:hypothetical protein
MAPLHCACAGQIGHPPARHLLSRLHALHRRRSQHARSRAPHDAQGGVLSELGAAHISLDLTPPTLYGRCDSSSSSRGPRAKAATPSSHPSLCASTSLTCADLPFNPDTNPPWCARPWCTRQLYSYLNAATHVTDAAEAHHPHPRLPPAAPLCDYFAVVARARDERLLALVRHP